ncbi:hypothetical protein KAH55_00460 [bacterium]|nr:hypothetical protein [bacterium]
MLQKWKPLLGIVAIALIVFASCQTRKTVTMPIAPEKFAEVFTGYIVGVEIYGEQYATAILDSVLQENSVTLDVYHQSMNYYAENPEEWESFIRLVIQDLSQRVTEVKLQREEALELRRLQKENRQ